MRPKKNQKVFNAKAELRKAKFYKMKDAVKSKLTSMKNHVVRRKTNTHMSPTEYALKLLSEEYVLNLLFIISLIVIVLPFILLEIGAISFSEEQTVQEIVSVPQQPQAQQSTEQPQQPQPTPQQPQQPQSQQSQPTQDAPVVVNNNINVSGNTQVTVNTTVNVD